MTSARAFARSTLLASIAATAFLPSIVAAQAPDAAADADIVVTGYVLQNREAIAAKRRNDRIGEFTSADEIGQQPDYNISDAFRRLPGVTTVFDEDEGRYVGIRGLNPNFTQGTLDGALLATAERQNRQLNMEAIPTTAISRLEVIKSRTPDIEGNAIGGIVNLITRSAFDARGFYLVGSAFVGQSDSTRIPGKGFNRNSDDGVNFRFDGTVSTTWGENDEFGIVMNGAFSRKRRDQERLLPGGYLPVGGVPVSNSLLWSTYPNTVDRYGGSAKVEYKPDERLYAAVSGTYFIQADNELRHSQQLTRNPATGVTSATSATTARVTSAGGFIRFNDFPINKPLYALNGVIDWSGDDGHRVTARGSWSKATFLEPSNQLQFNLSNSAANPYTETVNDGIPIAVLDNPATYNNPASYAFGSYTPYRDDSTDIVREGQLDWAYNNEGDDEGFGLGAGLKYRSITRDFDTQQAVWGPAPGVTLNAANFVLPVTYVPVLTGQDRPQPFIDFAAFQRFFLANPALFSLNATATNLNARSRDYVVDEKVMAAYALVSHRGERHSVILGGRYEDTETGVRGFRIAGNTLTPLSRRGTYRNFLPSVTANYDLTEGLKLRLGYYKAIGRPNPSDLGTNETLNTTAFTLSRGNPDLRPRKADNFDASLEYYFPGNAASLQAAVFYKDIKDDIFSANAGTTIIDGQSYTITQAQNLEGSRIFGIEGGIIVNKLAFLPGFLGDFGFSANATYLDARARFPGGLSFDRLTLQPTIQTNAALFFQRGPFQARASYAYIGKQFTVIAPAAPLTNRFDRPYHQLDAQARVKVGQFELIAEGRNLTKSYRQNFDGLGTRDQNFYGRQFWLGVAFKL